MTRPSAGGRIEVICGCMFSGKTEELIRRMRQVQIARQSCRVFTPRLDTRYSSSHVASHSGRRLEAVPVSSIKEVIAGAEGLQVIAIDELHFLEDRPEEIVAGCQDLADRGLRVLVAGLDQNYRAEPFPAIAQLMALAEQVDKLYAICVRCGAYATRSQRLIDGRAAPANAPTIVVGDLDLYEARCRACYEAAV
ncbi:thymidine kinase [Candidatus Oscillochloris fontis]|uniref:thymidine kinase n=1 Tax=Candidatus Oscillochloris fontis TaxID=2496868 RepID=UPI00101C4105|nr:thymidine kinase [Candidatus Oscillochloris fontis]